MVVSYTNDTKEVEFKQGIYAKRMAEDKEVLNNYKAWLEYFEKVEIGNCIVTGKGESIESDECYFIFHSIAPTYMEITKDSCSQMLQ